MVIEWGIVSICRLLDQNFLEFSLILRSNLVFCLFCAGSGGGDGGRVCCRRAALALGIFWSYGPLALSGLRGACGLCSKFGARRRCASPSEVYPASKL